MNGFRTPRQTLTRRALLRGAGAVAGLGLAGGFDLSALRVGAAGTTALRTPTATIPHSLFGMHIHRATTSTPWPVVPFKTWRLWDAGVMWPDLEPRRGVFRWDHLDAVVALAEQRGVEPVLVLGLTPTWASLRPEQVSDYGPGTSPAEPTNMQDWTNYITAVATRYRGRIKAYEIWNEPNAQYFSGDVMAIFRLTQAAHGALKRVDPTIQVISPAFMNDPDYLDIFLSYGGGRYIDVLGYHFYTAPWPPEDMVAAALRVKRVMANRGFAATPIWNTEIGWQSDNFVDDDQRRGFVARTALLNWALGIERFGWYAWDNHDWCTLWMTERDDTTLAPAATAFATIQRWMVGARMTSCENYDGDMWICTMLQPGGRLARIIWNTRHSIPLTLPASWDVGSVRSLDGAIRQIEPGARLMVGMSPILLAPPPDRPDRLPALIVPLGQPRGGAPTGMTAAN